MRFSDSRLENNFCAISSTENNFRYQYFSTSVIQPAILLRVAQQHSKWVEAKLEVSNWRLNHHLVAAMVAN
jgi:hypothetical protein